MTKESKCNQATDNKDVTTENKEKTSVDSTAENTIMEGNEEAPIVDQCAVLAEEVAKWQEKYVRLSAEFDNFRKRTLKEKMELIETASEDVLKSILVIVDDMDRAVAANKNSEDIAVLRSGTEIIHKKMCDILRGKGVKEIEALDSELDTDIHEAIAKFPVEDKDKKGKIIDVIEKGYKLKDKVIRYSKVVVGE